MRKVYLDSAPVIYLIERTAPFYARLQELLKASDLLILSDLTRLECCVLPLRRGDRLLLADFDSFFATRVAEIVAISTEVIDRATEIRAQYGYKTLDSIHLSAALVAGCDVFLTNDLRLKGFADIQIITL